MALTSTPFSPVVDGVLLPDAPWRALSQGAALGIDLLVGHTRDECSLLNTRRGAEMTDEQVATTHGRLASALDRNGYRSAYPEATPAQLYETLNSDWLIRMPSLQLADAHHAGGGHTWLYELCWGFDQKLGASHSLDFLLVFGTLDVDEVRNHPSALPAAADQVNRVSGHMRSDWVRFASTGNPGWAPYNPGTRFTRVYTANPTTRSYPEERSRLMWCTHQFDALDLPT
jgi:para-nitrobenzyl esterase